MANYYKNVLNGMSKNFEEFINDKNCVELPGIIHTMINNQGGGLRDRRAIADNNDSSRNGKTSFGSKPNEVLNRKFIVRLCWANVKPELYLLENRLEYFLQTAFLDVIAGGYYRLVVIPNCQIEIDNKMVEKFMKSPVLIKRLVDATCFLKISEEGKSLF